MGETSRNVIEHCLQALNAMGLPEIIKTNNRPAYTGKNFTSFCKEFGIECKTRIPYNPMGREIIECVHHTLKNWLLKTKEGELYTPRSLKAHFVSICFKSFAN
jgi:transposase InsO family protein